VKLYVTVGREVEKGLCNRILQEWPDAVVSRVENRGRDIAPFLSQAALAVREGIDLICKVHTKKSPHRADGDEWRSDLYRKLLGGAYPVTRIIDAFANNAALGILAPEGHILPSSSYWGSNAARVRHLAERIGYQGDPTPFHFAAGSMFWIRAGALTPILDLALDSGDFEEEGGQVDGTLAHSIERLFPIAAKLNGFRLADTRILSFDHDKPIPLRSDLELAALVDTEEYQFAAKG
jgi:lipopolysaccharide biosynthesis protein